MPARPDAAAHRGGATAPTRAGRRWREAIRTLVVRGAPAIGVRRRLRRGAGRARRVRAERHGRLRRATSRRRIKGLGADAPHRGQPLLGARSHAARGRAPSARRPVDRRAGAASRGGPGDPRGGPRGKPRDGRPRRRSRARGRRAFSPTAMPARSPPRATAPRSGSIRAAHERGKLGHGVGGRDAARDAGLAAHRVGDGQGGHSSSAHLRRGRRRSSMKRGEVDLVVTGADRIAANGDTANKIGTYWRGGARPASRHPVLRRGALLDHRRRHRQRRRHRHRGARCGRGAAAWRAARPRPSDSPVYNPAFDVTPGRADHRASSPSAASSAPRTTSREPARPGAEVAVTANRDLEAARRYHDAHPALAAAPCARAATLLDWDTKPSPFKIYPDLPVVRAPARLARCPPDTFAALSGQPSAAGRARPRAARLAPLLLRGRHEAPRRIAGGRARCTSARRRPRARSTRPRSTWWRATSPDSTPGVYHFCAGRLRAAPAARRGLPRGARHRRRRRGHGRAAGDPRPDRRSTGGIRGSTRRAATGISSGTRARMLANLLATATALDLTARVVTGFVDARSTGCSGSTRRRKARSSSSPVGAAAAGPPPPRPWSPPSLPR